MKNTITAKLAYTTEHFGLEAPVTIAVATLVEKAWVIGEEETLRFITSLINLALEDEMYEDEPYEDEDDDEPYEEDLEMGFDPYAGCYTWDC